jgi:hypothetical protein
MISRFGGYHSFRSHLSFLPRRRIGVAVVANGGFGSAFSSLLAAFVYDLEAGRASAWTRANERLAELEASVRRAAAQAVIDAESAARWRKEFSAAAVDRLTGRYVRPDFGTIVVERQSDRLIFRWGAIHGDVRGLDVASGTASFEFAGDEQPARFSRSAGGEGTELVFQGLSFLKASRLP